MVRLRCACPISAAAHREFLAFAETAAVPCWELLVVEQRPLSQLLAELTGVAHASPQAMLLVDGKPVWHASHWSITRATLDDACKLD